MYLVARYAKNRARQRVTGRVNRMKEKLKRIPSCLCLFDLLGLFFFFFLIFFSLSLSLSHPHPPSPLLCFLTWARRSWVYIFPLYRMTTTQHGATTRQDPAAADIVPVPFFIFLDVGGVVWRQAAWVSGMCQGMTANDCLVFCLRDAIFLLCYFFSSSILFLFEIFLAVIIHPIVSKLV